MKPSSSAPERRQSGKQWLEFLALELGMNTVELKGAIGRANRRPDGTHIMNTGTIKGQFTEERLPSTDFQMLVRSALSDLIARGKLGTWRDDLHSYAAFCEASQVIKAPMRFDRRYVRSVPSYLGSFAIIRANFDNGTDVDYISVLAPLPSGAYLVEWWLKDLVDGRNEYVRHFGYGHLSDRQLSIEVARALTDRDARTMKMSVSRNDNDHPSRLVGIKTGCCAIDGAPHARHVYLIKMADQPLSEPDWRRRVLAMEADIQKRGRGDMQFPEVHAPNSAIRDIPDYLVKLATDGIGRAANDSTAIDAKRSRAQRRKA